MLKYYSRYSGIPDISWPLNLFVFFSWKFKYVANALTIKGIIDHNSRNFKLGTQ